MSFPSVRRIRLNILTNGTAIISTKQVHLLHRKLTKQKNKFKNEHGKYIIRFVKPVKSILKKSAKRKCRKNSQQKYISLLMICHSWCPKVTWASMITTPSISAMLKFILIQNYCILTNHLSPTFLSSQPMDS